MIESTLRELLTFKYLVLYAYVACVVFVHFRGRERFRFMRQLTEHSGLFSPFNVIMYAFSAVSRKPFLPVSDFPELAPLRENWEVFRDEAKALYEEGHIRQSERHNDLSFVAFYKRGWKRYYLKWYSDFMPSAQATCPRSCELVSKIPGINAAMFSLLPAGGKLGRHRDPFAGSLRYHVGLVTPNDDACWIKVDGEPYSWRDGEDVVFDETYIHEAKNDTDQDRIILFCDVTRPLHFAPVRVLSRFMNRYVFSGTRSQNVPSDGVGFLNHVTPLIYRFKTWQQGFKKRRKVLYLVGKHGMVLVALYFIFVHRHLV